MLSTGLTASLINKIALILEETLMIVLEKNKAKKQILGDCTVIITKDTVNLIIRDNGVLFDITKEDKMNSSLRHYIVARMIDNSNESSYLLTISSNRNSYMWRR